MLTHGNLVSNLSYARDYFDLASGQVGISFLPLSHVTARHLDYVLFSCGVTIAYCPNFTLMPQYLSGGPPHYLRRGSTGVREAPRQGPP